MVSNTVIVCPTCGRQYLPGEIYLPKHFTGQPTKVIREVDGSIMDFDGVQQNLRENYVCDKCDCKFSVEAIITYTTRTEEPKILLKED